MRTKGISLTDIVGRLVSVVERMTLPVDALTFILGKLSDIEFVPLPRLSKRARIAEHTRCRTRRYHLSFGANEAIQLSALVGTFVIARQRVLVAARPAAGACAS